MSAKGLFGLSILTGSVTVGLTMIGYWHPNSTEAGLSFAGSLGLGAISGGIWFYNVIAGNPFSTQAPAIAPVFDISKPHEIVDFIDTLSTSCVLATNNQWLNLNWHTMSDDVKTKWVTTRFTFLVKNLNGCASTMELLNAIQMSDKEYCRSQPNVA